MRSAIRILPALVAGILVAGIVLAGCGDGGGQVSAGTRGPADQGRNDDRRSMEGEYVSTGVEEDGKRRELVNGTSIRLLLEDGRLSASAGCNSIGGDYTIDGGVMRVGALATTEIGCDPARHDQDEWLADLLASEPTIEPIEEGFVLGTANVEVTFVDHSIVDPDRELVDTTWVVDGYFEGTGPDGVASSAVRDDAQLLLVGNGFVTGHDGCNGFGYGGTTGAEPTDGLRYEIDGSRITFSGGAVGTTIACTDVDTERFWSVLRGTVAWEIDGSGLTLVDAAGNGVTYTAR